MPSRVERNPQLQGTKRRVAMERELLVARGRSDGRTVLIVPEVKGAQCTGITLLHVCSPSTCRRRWPGPCCRAGIAATTAGGLGDGDRAGFRDDLLGQIPVVDLLTVPVSDLAELWRSA